MGYLLLRKFGQIYEQVGADKFWIKILAKLEPELAHNLILYPLKMGISAKFVKLSSADAARLKPAFGGLILPIRFYSGV